MATIPQVDNTTAANMRSYGLCDLETWKEVAKTVTAIAAFAILPLASYLAAGSIACAAVLSLEIVCYIGYQMCNGITKVAEGVLSPVANVVATSAEVASRVGNPVASWR